VDEELRRELAALRVQVARLHRPAVRHGWLSVVIKDLETDPQTQYKVHLWAVRIWLVNMLAAVIVFAVAQGVWARISVLYLVIVSLYANAATDYGAMSAALAVQHEPPLPEIPGEPPRGM